MATREKRCRSSRTHHYPVCAWCGCWRDCEKNAERGTPAAIQVDNGTEFTSRVVDQWAYQNHVALHFIDRGKPTQNALIESFNGKFRDECLNQNWFVDVRHARQVIEAWRVDYNTVRPHSSLRYLTPEEFAATEAARPRLPPRRSSLSPRRGQVRMCRNPRVLTYDWTKNGGQVTASESAGDYFVQTNSEGPIATTAFGEPVVIRAEQFDSKMTDAIISSIAEFGLEKFDQRRATCRSPHEQKRFIGQHLAVSVSKLPQGDFLLRPLHRKGGGFIGLDADTAKLSEADIASNLAGAVLEAFKRAT